MILELLHISCAAPGTQRHPDGQQRKKRKTQRDEGEDARRKETRQVWLMEKDDGKAG